MTLYQSLIKAYEGQSPWKEVEEELARAGVNGKGKFTEPFTNLVIGILSQNTSDRNSTRAYIGLVRKFKKINPDVLAKAKLIDIKKAIKPGGLYNIKAKRIKDLAILILSKGGKQFLKRILSMPKHEAKNELLKIKGLGVKTVDVFLGYCGDYDTLPVDTNIKRVAKRLGLVNDKAVYSEIQDSLRKVLPKGGRRRGHELLIRIGRDYCKPLNPKCSECPINKFCNYYKVLLH